MSTAPRRARGRPKAFDDKTEQNTIRALDRAMTVLEEVSRHEGIALSELAERMGESAATLYRVLTTLSLHDIAEFDEAGQVWHVGPGAFRVGSAFLRRTSVVERSRPILRRLMEQTGETANLGVAAGDVVLFVSQVETHETIRAFFPPGTQGEMHTSGIGKALLAHFNPERLDRWLTGRTLKGYTEKSITTPDALRAELAMIHDRGYSVDDEERNLGMRCIAAPVFDTFGEPAAGISISGPTARIPDSAITGIARVITTAATELTTAIGGRPPAKAA
jgi:IclR family acetate operon transcriptional repressor